MWLFDSHIHLADPAYEHDMSYILTNMQQMKIKACCVSVDNVNSDQTLFLSQKSQLVLPFIGIHPEKAHDNLDTMISKIHQNHNIICGIGEIGLDPTYGDSARQSLVFETLLSLAEKYKKPVSIHSRKSLTDIFEILPSFSLPGKLLHWFDGSKKQLQHAMDLDCYVSFGPVAIYANDKQSLIQKSNLDKLLVETDGPVTFSRCFEQKPAQISFIPSVVFCMSKLLKKSYDELSLILNNNSTRYLDI